LEVDDAALSRPIPPPVTVTDTEAVTETEPKKP